MKSTLPRGGHMPSHLREKPFEAIEAERFAPYTRWQVNVGGPEQARRVTGRLWNCTDVVPGAICEDAGIPRGRSFAQRVRQLRHELNRLT